MQVEIVFVDGAVQIIQWRVCSSAMTIQEIVRSLVPDKIPVFDMDSFGVGIDGIETDWNAVPNEGERIEIFNRLLVDPKEARRQRAHSERHHRLKNPHSTTSSS